MDDMRMVKFESLIKDINYSLWGRRNNERHKNTSLSLVFDYEKCDDYAKVIMDNSLIFYDDNNFFEGYCGWYKYDLAQPYFNNPKDKIGAAKKFLDFFIGRNSFYAIRSKLLFIFWNLMILTVDKSDAEEHLTLICDFAQSLHISDEEFEDIIQVIKMVYNRSGDRKILQSENVKKYFTDILDSFGIH